MGSFPEKKVQIEKKKLGAILTKPYKKDNYCLQNKKFIHFIDYVFH